MTWLSSSGRGMPFGDFSGEHGISERAQRVLNDPKGFWGSNFDQIPVSIIFDVAVRTAFFVLWAMQHKGSYFHVYYAVRIDCIFTCLHAGLPRFLYVLVCTYVMPWHDLKCKYTNWLNNSWHIIYTSEFTYFLYFRTFILLVASLCN